MSAFIQSKDHIDLLVTAAIDRDLRWFTDDRPRTSDKTYREVIRNAKEVGGDAIGSMLVAANVQSVSYRYSDSDDLPGPVDAYYGRPFKYERVTSYVSVGTLLNAVAGYEYQSCEHDEWEVSEARFFCTALREALCREVTGDGIEGWSWDRPARASA